MSGCSHQRVVAWVGWSRSEIHFAYIIPILRGGGASYRDLWDFNPMGHDDYYSCNHSEVAFFTSLNRQTKLKFMFSKKATKRYKIFTIDLTLTKWTPNRLWRFCNFDGLLRKHELYLPLFEFLKLCRFERHKSSEADSKAQIRLHFFTWHHLSHNTTSIHTSSSRKLEIRQTHHYLLNKSYL